MKPLVSVMPERPQVETEPRRALRQWEVAQLMQSQRGFCAGCQAKLYVGSFEADHIIALALGGTNALTNFQLLCKVCHNAKSRGEDNTYGGEDQAYARRERPAREAGAEGLSTQKQRLQQIPPQADGWNGGKERAMTWSVEVSAEAVACVAPFISTEDTRYYINGVCIERAKDGVVVVATNGHCLGAYHDPEAQIEGEFDRPIFKVPPPVKDNLRAKWIPIVPDEDDEPEYVRADGFCRRVRFHSDGRVTLIRGGLDVTTAHGCLIDGEFVNWRKAVPEAVSRSPVATQFAACYLSDFGSMSLNYDGRDHSPLVVLPASDAISPALVLTNDPNFLGVIMPKKEQRKIADFDPAAWLRERLGEPKDYSPAKPAKPQRRG